MGPLLTIGRLAKHAGVGLQTLLFYEREGLLSPTSRTEAGYRLYAPEVIEKLRFIKNSQKLGFSLQQVRKLQRLRASRKNQCAAVRKLAREQAKALQERRRAYEGMERSLAKLLKECGSRQIPCRFLNALASESGVR